MTTERSKILLVGDNVKYLMKFPMKGKIVKSHGDGFFDVKPEDDNEVFKVHYDDLTAVKP